MGRKKKLWLAISISALSSPLMCGGMIGLAMGEKPMPDGSIGQEPWQFPLSMLFGAMSIVYLIVLISLFVVLIKRGMPNFSMWLVRISGLPPLVCGISMFVASYQRIVENLYAEAIGACIVGLLLCLLAYRLVITREPEFQVVDS